MQDVSNCRTTLPHSLYQNQNGGVNLNTNIHPGLPQNAANLRPRMFSSSQVERIANHHSKNSSMQSWKRRRKIKILSVAELPDNSIDTSNSRNNIPRGFCSKTSNGKFSPVEREGTDISSSSSDLGDSTDYVEDSHSVSEGRRNSEHNLNPSERAGIVSSESAEWEHIVPSETVERKLIVPWERTERKKGIPPVVSGIQNCSDLEAENEHIEEIPSVKTSSVVHCQKLTFCGYFLYITLEGYLLNFG
eukprot:TRINITY_DN1755_c0_g1_i1.p1 TRINITY_DN1755_c0_g1~~TRINITY_DN1755_c0_g1_i1.p1  ORF type:complete len:247 (+),score=27.18 TRINITY_DN1755_c0_g1_i1:67-807(+)